jgi:uncharacterized membrane protein YhhN
MKTWKVALGLYITASVLAIVATIFDCDTLKLLSIPAVIPAIFFYYLSVKRHQRLDPYIVSILALNFIGDTIVLLEVKETEIIMIPYFFSHLLMLRFAIIDVRKIRFNKNGMLLALGIFAFLMYLMYELITLFVDGNPDLFIPVIVYGLVLGSFVSLAGYCYYAKNSTVAFYMAIAALMGVVSDVFYIVFSLIVHFPGFNYFEFSVQMFSYFFIVKYCVLRKN